MLGVLGVDMLALLVDCGVLCLPALPGVLWVLARVAINSLFIPLCLDVLLQVWQVAISTEEDFWKRCSRFLCARLSRLPLAFLRRTLCTRADGRCFGRIRSR